MQWKSVKHPHYRPAEGCRSRFKAFRGYRVGKPVWPNVPSKMDVHGYRAVYATEVYAMYARDEIPKEDKYICRKDQKGIILDKKSNARSI